MTVFLDHQSSTPVLPEVLEGMRPYFLELSGSPSSLHQHGLRAREALQRAREAFAALIGAESSDDIIFTSSGTEATNLAIKGVAFAGRRHGNHIVATAAEHPAVQKSVEFLQQQGFSSTWVPVDREGWVDPAAVSKALTDQTVLVCVHHANHDVGTIQSISQIAEIANQRGIPVFVDATTSAGWLPIDVQSMGVGLLSLAPHRFYGPKGVGALYRHRGVRLTSLLHGGDQEHGHRAGMENIPAIVGGGIAAEVAARDLSQRRIHTERLQRGLWDQLRSALPYLALHGPEPGPKRISTNLNISAEFTEGEGQLLSLDMAGIAVASGTSCVSKSMRLSPVLSAMGVDPALARASIILTLGKDNTPAEMEHFVATFARVITNLRGMSPLWEEFQRGLLDSIVQPRQPRLETSDSRLAAKR
jgi:cysteine desulfurase